MVVKELSGHWMLMHCAKFYADLGESQGGETGKAVESDIR
jgi:hypothetical protein